MKSILDIPMIDIQNITFGYDGTLVFVDFSWQVQRGESWAVLGPSGCGKSTLLYLLSGLRFPSRGSLLLDSQQPAGPRPRTGLILQDYGLLPWATAEKNIRLGLEIRGFYGPDGKHAPADFHVEEHQEKVSYWIKRLRLEPHLQKYPGQLSGGQRQRVAIARTLALDPDLLLMDEPFAALDAPTRASLQDLTFELSREHGLTLLIVTHSVEEAAVMGEKILLMGEPPTQKATIIDNPQAIDLGFRETAVFFSICSQLRHKLDG